LNRPSQQAYFFFEPFLKLDLLDLRSRGYNVDRILRAKAAEARVAEEERLKALQAEQQSIQEREREWAQQQQQPVEGAARESARTPKSDRMPGGFQDSPEEESPALPQQRKNRGLFSNISRRLGFDIDDEFQTNGAEKQMNNFLPESAPTPTPAPQEKGKRPRVDNDGRVTSPAVVQRNLLSAINSARPDNSSAVFSPPKNSTVKEQATYCDDTPSQNIIFAAEAPGGMRFFVAKDILEPRLILTEKLGPIRQFEQLLNDVAAVYGLSPRTFHMFFDEKGSTIAFNRRGSIFCNLRFFEQLHYTGYIQNAEKRVEATTWWWVITAHELSHNLVEPHNSDHSYYT
jgi:hypothetical protein